MRSDIEDSSRHDHEPVRWQPQQQGRLVDEPTDDPPV
jgi:hypothetical protein